jgi:hypothetical protein
MIVGYFAFGIVVGLAAAMAALLTGTSWQGVLGIYTLSVALSVLLCAGGVALRRSRREAGPTRAPAAAHPAE